MAYGSAEKSFTSTVPLAAELVREETTAEGMDTTVKQANVLLDMMSTSKGTTRVSSDALTHAGDDTPAPGDTVTRKVRLGGAMAMGLLAA